jgi:uracil-DNA glycosylase
VDRHTASGPIPYSNHDACEDEHRQTVAVDLGVFRFIAASPGCAAHTWCILTSLSVVREQIVTCERCPRLRAYCQRIGRQKRRAFLLDTYWARPVPGFGDPRARLLIVGLAPAAHGANRTGRVFTGDGVGGSGDFLMAALNRAGFANIGTSRRPDDGLVLTDAYIAAAVRCAPPDNKPTPEEVARCLPHLAAELSALPNVGVVVALGKIGFDAYLQLLRGQGINLKPRPAFGHDSVATLPNGHILIGCYHPSRQNTNTGRLTAPMMDDVFRSARRRLGPGGRRGAKHDVRCPT